jgi:hypothetical protein
VAVIHLRGGTVETLLAQLALIGAFRPGLNHDGWWKGTGKYSRESFI